MSYEKSIQQIDLISQYGFQGVKVVNQEFQLMSLAARAWTRSTCALSRLWGGLPMNPRDTQLKYVTIRSNVASINAVHRRLQANSPEFNTVFKNSKIITAWNRRLEIKFPHHHEDLKIDQPTAPVTIPELPSHLFSCSFITGQKMPLVISPTDITISHQAFLGQVAQHQAAFQTLKTRYGALLFRGVPGQNKDNFVEFLKAALGRLPVDYKGGDGSRHKVGENVYTSTEAPQWARIPQHQERAHTSENPPPDICFECEIAPAPGSGQTILASAKKVTAEMQKNPDLWKLFEGKRATYVSRHPPNGSLFNRVNVTHKTWQDAFEIKRQTEDVEARATVEKVCEDKKIPHRWNGKWLETVYKDRPCTRPDPDDASKSLFFNQVHLHDANPVLRNGWVNHILANLLYCWPSTVQLEYWMEDGKKLPRWAINDLYDILEKNTVQFDWEKGDILIVDNIRTMHGRERYVGPRSIVVSLMSDRPFK